MHLLRRAHLLLLGLCALAAPAVRANVDRVAMTHERVAALARELVAEPYEPPREMVSKYFRELNYDDYHRIRFIPENSLWREEGLPFQVQFFHPGYLFNRTVELNEFTPTHVQPIPFTQKFFDYQDLRPSFWAKRGLNYAGFRVLHQLNEPDKWDELISFLGASYFRALGRGHRYGLSARGLAINSAVAAPEEFPSFIEFWLGKPADGASSITLHALLDSPSVAGAYTFVVKPGATTIVDVRATLLVRRGVELPGLAPMSSMFWFGEASPDRQGDFRPEVHDSDGLLVAPDANTRLWRPLGNPSSLRHADFPAAALAGFGLLQRDRDFESYQDLQARYERRPGLWVEPLGRWPAGRVRLAEIPTRDEYADNIVAYFVPAEPWKPGEVIELSWRLHWTSAGTFGGPPGWVRATRHQVVDGAPGRSRFIVDFAGVPDGVVPEADVTVSGPARVDLAQVIRNEPAGTWRLVVAIAAPGGAGASELRATLRAGGRAVSETWVAPWKP